MGASSPARPYLYGGLFLFLLVTIFLICAAAVPRFGDVKVAVSSDQVSGSASFTLGAFQVCLDVFIINVCVPISSSCELSSSGVGGQALNLPTLPYCGTYNAFRGFLITSLVLAGLALVAALAHTFMASPSPNIGPLHICECAAVSGHRSHFTRLLGQLGVCCVSLPGTGSVRHTVRSQYLCHIHVCQWAVILPPHLSSGGHHSGGHCLAVWPGAAASVEWDGRRAALSDSTGTVCIRCAAAPAAHTTLGDDATTWRV